ncbi:MAG: NAD(P)/FAD-dependent oxidoreductase, partial [Candidatus Methylomirabilales bacterium]
MEGRGSTPSDSGGPQALSYDHPRLTVGDVIIVGAGPAGTTIATLLAEKGHRVLLLDKATFPREKPCGEYLSPGCLPILDRIGALKAVEGKARRIRGMRITSPDGT